MLDETLLPEALRPGTRLLVEQFASALASKGLSLPEQHLGDRVTVQEFRRQFTTAFAASEYIAKTCIVCPELLLDLVQRDRKSTRLNSSHVAISYALSC